jgi:hypothetical protein
MFFPSKCNFLSILQSFREQLILKPLVLTSFAMLAMHITSRPTFDPIERAPTNRETT